MKDKYIGYKIFRNIIVFIGNILFWGKVIGRENIPKNKSCILAGNHTGNFDGYLLYKSTKRPIHIIAKQELINSKFGWFFKILHLIPVDRKHKNEEAKEVVLSLLKNNKIIGIFPEGTYHDLNSKTKKELLLPFKPGAVSFALKSNTPIVPFAIVGKIKLFSSPKIIFGKPININEIDGDKIKYLEDRVRELLTKKD